MFIGNWQHRSIFAMCECVCVYVKYMCTLFIYVTAGSFLRHLLLLGAVNMLKLSIHILMLYMCITVC